MKFEYSDWSSPIIGLMRIPATWWWIPAAVTVAGLVYISMVKLSGYQATRNWPVSVRETPKPFTPPPPTPRRQPKMVEETPVEEAPVEGAPDATVAAPRQQSPALPGIELPPFHPVKTK
jgi:hypothetical protein